MEISVKPGRYVVAVSGGVDSMVLLDLLRHMPDLELIVAHFDHGIRTDSAEDMRLVQHIADSYGLQFVSDEGKLGPQASEAMARQARYDFLERARANHHADAIITAHHQDDWLETAILNILRGTGRKGLTSLADRPHIQRPLLHISKQELIAYAHSHGLTWHEDSTNADDKYLRNYIRHNILPQFDVTATAQLVEVLEESRQTNRALDAELGTILGTMSDGATLDRRAFASLPHDIAKELLATWLRDQGIADFDHKTLERVVVAAKTKSAGARIDIISGTSLLLTKDKLALMRLER